MAILKERLAKTGGELNEARMRMARIPHGAALVANKVSGAPGFWIGNVITMAGIPAVMQGMLDEVAPRLKTGTKLLSATIRADAKEGDVGTELGAIAKAHPETIIGSYPFIDETHGPNTNIVVRSRDADKLAVVKAEVEGMLAKSKIAAGDGALGCTRRPTLRSFPRTREPSRFLASSARTLFSWVPAFAGTNGVN